VKRVLRFLAPFVVSFLLTSAITTAWHYALGEDVKSITAYILGFGIAFVVLANWPQRWRS
jgi:hypothetical protein